MTTPAPESLAARFVAFTLRYGKPLWALALVLAIPATWRTISMYAHLKSDVEELLPRDAESVRAVAELRARLPGLQYLGVIVDTKAAENLPEGERLLDDLAARVRSYPKELARSARTGDFEERAFLEKNAPLYVDLPDLVTIRRRVEARRDWEFQHDEGFALGDDDSPAPPLDFSDIERKYRERSPPHGETDGPRYSSKKLHLTLMLIEVGVFESGASAGKKLLDRVKADLRDLGAPAKYSPHLEVGFTGDVAINVEETSALIADLSLSSVLVLASVALVILLYYRWWRSVFVLVPPLLLATVYTFGLASLPPLSITELNSNTAFLGSIIVGNGINFGIVLLARYVEERRKGLLVEPALVVAVAGSRAGTFSAAVAAGVSYAALILTTFRGFRQFGWIGGLGMLLSWSLSFLLMPPLAAWLDRGAHAAPKPIREDARIMTRLTRVIARLALPISVAGLVLTGLAATRARHFTLNQLEYDFSKLRSRKTWTEGEGYWGGKMDALLGAYLTPIVLLADDARQAAVIEARLRRDTGAVSGELPGPLAGRIASVRTLADVVPNDQAEKIREATALRDDLTPKIRSLVPDDKRLLLDKLLGERDLQPISAEDLPPALMTALRERDGSVGRTVLVYPAPSKSLWEGPALVDFVRRVRAAAAEGSEFSGGRRPARVAGSLPISADIVGSIAHDGPIASLAAFLGVALVTFAVFRFRRTSLWVTGALVTGVLWLLGAALGLGVRINFANFIAFPITFGIGVDYAVNVVSRYVQDAARTGRPDILGAVRSTGSAVALCSLTTILGYSSLLLADNRALYLFGLLAVLGEVCCLTAAVVFLPALILVASRARALTQHSSIHR